MVRPRPRVVVISTGSELVDPGLELSNEQQIFDSNSYCWRPPSKPQAPRSSESDKSVMIATRSSS